MNSRSFGKLADGREITLYTLKNSSGMTVTITDYAGTVVDIIVADKNGGMGDVSLGFERAADYEASQTFMGCLVGRHANRIANAQFVLDGVEYKLAQNDGSNNLHGGPGGLHSKIWQVDAFTPTTLSLSTSSPDGEEGFPGNIQVQVTYTLTEDNGLQIDYSATTDRPTILNMTNHAYFNLAGSGRVDDHEMMMFADQITPVNEISIPLGHLMPVDQTPFDLRQPRRVGDGLNSAHEQIKLTSGYDHNFVIRNGGAELVQSAKVFEPTSGRVMEVFTTEPGIQLYTGNFLKGETGKGGQIYTPHTGLCLETQRFPDSPNNPDFPTAELRPGETYAQTTVYRFAVIGSD